MIRGQWAIVAATGLIIASVGGAGCSSRAQSQPASVESPASVASPPVLGGPLAGSATAAVSGSAWFEDMTPSSGIHFRHVSGNSPAKPFPAANGSGLAAVDYDRDGRIDLYFATGTPFPLDLARQEPTNRLYRNRGDWQFEDVTEFAGAAHNGFSAGLAVGDYDSDGFPDLYVTCFGPNCLLHNEGDGTFTRVETAAGVADERWGASAAFLDYDEDGLLDLYVCNYAKWSWERNPFCGDRVRRIRMHCHPRSHEPERHILYHNEGDGTFRDASDRAGVGGRTSRGQGVVAADLDGDGHIDLYVANDANPNFLFLNEGGGHFRDATEVSGAAYDGLGVARAGMGVDAGDINGDGRPELFVGNFQNEYKMLYENLGDGLFQDASHKYGLVADALPYVTWGAQFADLDLDGWPDLIAANGHVDDNLHLFGQDAPYAEPPLCYRNLGGKRFQFLGATAGAYFAQLHVGRGLVTADLDNDGDLDVAICHQDDLSAVLRNTALERQPDVATIALRLVGTASSRDAVGASVRCRSQRGTLTQHVKGGSSYNSAPDLLQVFAANRGESGVTIQIRWPRGLVSDFTVEAGRQYVVIEPRAPAAAATVVPVR
jgi:hypothetical protein